MNRAILCGNLGADPELRFTQGGQAVLSIRLATEDQWLDRQTGEQKKRTDWHSVVVWGKRGEGLAKHLAKGSKILVEGSIQTSSYDDRDGNKRYKTEIIASNVELLGGGPRREGGASQGAAPAPNNGGGYQRPAATAGGPPPDDFGGGFGSGRDDDIPF